jgi:hypothetical protein
MLSISAMNEALFYILLQALHYLSRRLDATMCHFINLHH